MTSLCFCCACAPTVGGHTEDCIKATREIKRVADEAATKWQPIESAPKDGTKILVYTVHGEIELTEWFQTKTPRYVETGEFTGLYKRVDDLRYEGWNSNTPTHWMPMPAAPVRRADEHGRS